MSSVMTAQSFHHNHASYVTDELLNVVDIQQPLEAVPQKGPKIKYITSTQQLQIEADQPITIEEIKLYSILGERIQQWSNLQLDASGALRVSLSNISKGTYLVSVKTKTGKYNKRLIIGK